MVLAAKVSYFLFVTDFGVEERGLAAALFVGLAALALICGVVTGASGMSPSRRLTGQILNAGHFLQPTAMAIGQIITWSPLRVLADASVWTSPIRESSWFCLTVGIIGCGRESADST